VRHGAEELCKMIQRRTEDLNHYRELVRNGVLSETAYQDLAARAERELQQARADLQSIESRTS
jgi:multidrug resistance efflux pump